MHAPSLLLFVSLLVSSLPAAAQYPTAPTPGQRSVSVSGSAEVKVAPDEILLNVGVETRHPRLDEAKKLNDESVRAALALLKRDGVPDKDVQTDYISIEPRYEYESDNRAALTQARAVPLVYVVRKSIGIRLTRVNEFENVLSGLLANGVQYIHGIEFRTSQLRKHRDAARALAVQAAKEKADALTQAMGVKRGAVQSISESYSGGWWRGGGGWGAGGGQMMQNVMQNAGGGEASEGGALSVGQISVNASVNATFAIE
ncbi:SIMPL domain-containing protein [Pseudomonas sp. CGJS7]|uniref:SIMPL domain-containing protein n=1 Tax=Pseudomonas sp. CGJS7 TaxID=3109348 RepID=UPI00300B051F